MSVGQDPDPTGRIVFQDDWVKASLAVPFVHKPGTTFLYNNIGPLLLSAIVQKVSGQKLLDYLRPRLFSPLGILDMDWDASPGGINPGGWGLRLKTEDLAKFGQLFLQKGRWKGRQLLPRKWVEVATSLHINTSVEHWVDWRKGYGYLFWRCRHDAYRADGAMGQYCIVLPRQDAVIVLTAESQDMQEELDLVWRFLLPSIRGDKLPANDLMAATLKAKLSSLSLHIPTGLPELSAEKRISGKTYSLEQNDTQIETMSFKFEGGICHLSLKTREAVFDLKFRSGRWEFGETLKHGPYLLAGAKDSLTGLPHFKVAGCCRWKDQSTLELTLRYIESPHSQQIVCHFDGDTISADFLSSIDQYKSKKTLKGIAEK